MNSPGSEPVALSTANARYAYFTQMVKSRWSRYWRVVPVDPYVITAEGFMIIQYGWNTPPFNAVAHAPTDHGGYECRMYQHSFISVRLEDLVHQDVRLCTRCLIHGFAPASDAPPWEAAMWEEYWRGMVL